MHVRRLRGDPERRPLRLGQPPAPRAGLEVRRGRMARRAEHVRTRLQVHRDVDRGGEAVTPALPEQIGVGRRQELLGRQAAEQAAHRAGEEQRPGPRADALAGHVADDQLEQPLVRGARGDHEVAAERGAARRTENHLRVPPAGQRRQLPGEPHAVAEVDEHRVAPDGLHTESRPAARDVQHHQRRDGRPPGRSPAGTGRSGRCAGPRTGSPGSRRRGCSSARTDSTSPRDAPRGARGRPARPIAVVPRHRGKHHGGSTRRSRTKPSECKNPRRSRSQRRRIRPRWSPIRDRHLAPRPAPCPPCRHGADPTQNTCPSRTVLR